MHPDVESDKPGHCPKCGMHLVPKVKSKDTLTCPVMIGVPVDEEESEKNGCVREFEGKKYYFCCNSCVEDFDADPNQYAK